MPLDTTIGFLGYGNMGQAILEGLVRKSVLRPDQASVYDVAPACLAAAERLGVRIAESEAALTAGCETLIAAVKPQGMAAALTAARPGVHSGMRAISIAAGVSIHFLQEHLGPGVRIIRVMPNTPALVGAGAAGIAFDSNCTDADRAVARTLFEAVGIAVFVEEHALDTVTALSGSGPAYFFHMVECLTQAAVAEGLDEATAAQLAAQTLLGAGLLLTQSGDSARVLREKVTSKGGTTEAALRHLGQGGFEALMAGAVHAASTRSRELGA
jgi:pyrroline-5-carboxylate reductase